MQTSEPKPEVTHDKRNQPTPITEELVQEVTEKVYALLLRELKIENERMRERFYQRSPRVGGWT